MAYAAIPNADVDADSPLTESLITQLRDNADQVKEEFELSHNFDGTTPDGTHIGRAYVSSSGSIGSGTDVWLTDAAFATGHWMATITVVRSGVSINVGSVSWNKTNLSYADNVNLLQEDATVDIKVDLPNNRIGWGRNAGGAVTFYYSILALRIDT